jgi:carbonic anhydrase/acetyltransferase-like protein (isoleucine patch superfamily)
MLAIGSPARVKRALTDEEKRDVQEGVDRYVRLGREHR